MCILKLILLLVYLIPIGVYGQFRIIGLLSVDDSKSNIKNNNNKLSLYQSNAQARRFNVDDDLKQFLIRPKHIIRIIDDINQNQLIPDINKIHMIQEQKPTVQRHKESSHVKSDTVTMKPDPLSLQTKKSSYQQRNMTQSNKNKYPYLVNTVKTDIVNRSSVSHPVRLNYNKVTKRNRFKSRCHCEKISNCPRIQISVSRCEPNHLLCCF